MKHNPISLLERAAQVYDFGAALRSDADRYEGAPAARDAEALEPAPPPAQSDPEPSVAEPDILELALADVAAPAAEPRVGGHEAPVDRLGLAEAGYIVPEEPVTGLAEEFRLIKRRLLADMKQLGTLPEEKRRSMLVCSPQSGEGKTFCAVNLALSLAAEPELEVLLVDGDFTKFDVPRVLGIEAGPGLVDALADPAADPEAFVIRTDVPGLSILPAGRRLNNVPELLASDRTRAVLARLAAADPRRIILFDSPPALMASPATVLAGHVGLALLVVRADRTTEADLRETVSLLAGCDHVALLLNAAALSVTSRRYGAYEGYGDGD